MRIALGDPPWCRKNGLRGSSIRESLRWEEECEVVSVFDAIEKSLSSDTIKESTKNLEEETES